MWLRKQSGTPAADLEKLGSLESELMERIWARGETSVRDLHAEFSARLAYTTVMTTLDRLYKKGLLDRRKQGKAFFYTPRMSEAEYTTSLTRHLLGMVLLDGLDGNDAQAVLSSFVDKVSETDRQMLDRLEQLVRAKRRALRRKEQE